MPEPLGKAIVTTTAMDANLNHILLTKALLTGTQRNRLQERQPHMVQSLLLQKQ